ncbi:MAG: hypothetical protein JNL90_10680 [Planctomycetes bacterium]|nr:hypothetical protein [Planctomycetota bacterium]
MSSKRQVEVDGARRRTSEPRSVGIWYSDDNGQIACGDHRDLYGRIPWRRMSVSEVVDFRAEVSDCVGLDEAICEVCRGNARRARHAADAEPTP